MLRNDLYSTGSVVKKNSAHWVSVKLNANHAIFNGHFPGQPVLPGVCMLEMVREILEEFLQQKLRISKGPLIKFLAMIIPDKTPSFTIEVNYETKESMILAGGKIFHEQVIFMKYNLELTPEPV